jgi:hypothetical protein
LKRILAKCPQALKAGELTGKYIENTETISVGALADVKGLEFSLVVIVGCSKDVIPNHQIPEGEYWRDAMRLYVAMTRGRDQVVMTYAGEPSDFLIVMKEHLLWDECEVHEVPDRQDPTPEAHEPTVPKIPQRKIITPPQTGFVLSASADALLRSYFERKTYRGNTSNLGSKSMRKFNSAYERWRTPRYLNGIKVSDLFSNREYRADLAEEIEAQLHKFGYRLNWD